MASIEDMREQGQVLLPQPIPPPPQQVRLAAIEGRREQGQLLLPHIPPPQQGQIQFPQITHPQKGQMLLPQVTTWVKYESAAGEPIDPQKK